MSKALIITTIAVVIIAAGATAAYILQRQEDEEVKEEQPLGTIPEEPVVQPPEAPSLSEPEPTTEPEINTSDWKTYKNEEYGYEIKYPPDFQIEDYGGIKGYPSHTLLIAKEGSFSTKEWLPSGPIYGIMTDLRRVWMPGIENEETRKQSIIESCGGLSSIETSGEIEISGKKGLKAICKGNGGAMVIIESNGKIYIISYEMRGSLKNGTEIYLKYLKYFDQILSTVRFLE